MKHSRSPSGAFQRARTRVEGLLKSYSRPTLAAEREREMEGLVGRAMSTPR